MRGRRRNGTRMAAGILLSLGLALGSLPVSGITAAELDTAEGQNVAAEEALEEVLTEAQPEAQVKAQTEVLPETQTETLPESAMPDAMGDTADTGAGAEASQTEEDRQAVAGEELPEETDAEAIVAPEEAEASVIVDDADAGAEEILPEDELITGIEIVAVEDSGTPAADGESEETLVPEGGDCGAVPDTVRWELDESGTLKVSGSGDMLSWDAPEQVPWDALRGEIREIVIAEGVTSVGAYAFCGCSEVESVEMAESVSVIGEAAFSYCSGFTTVSIG